MKCNKCGAELPDGSQFCNVCGNKIDTNLKCVKCSADIPKDSQFCNICGTKVAASNGQSKDVPQNEPIKQVQQTPVTQNVAKPSIFSLRNIALAIGGIIALFIVVSVIAAFISGMDSGMQSISNNAKTVTITGDNLDISYTGSTSGYFGPTSQAISSTPLTLKGGQQLTSSFTITSSALLLNHDINQISVTTPGFTLNSVTPNLPITLSPGSSVRVTLTITAPNEDYSGPITYNLGTT